MAGGRGYLHYIIVCRGLLAERENNLQGEIHQETDRDGGKQYSTTDSSESHIYPLQIDITLLSLRIKTPTQ